MVLNIKIRLYISARHNSNKLNTINSTELMVRRHQQIDSKYIIYAHRILQEKKLSAEKRKCPRQNVRNETITLAMESCCQMLQELVPAFPRSSSTHHIKTSLSAFYRNPPRFTHTCKSSIQMEVEIPMGRNNFWGCPAHWKAFGVSAAVKTAKGIIQSSITAWCCCSQMQFYPLVGVTLHCPEKNPPPAMRSVW